MRNDVDLHSRACARAHADEHAVQQVLGAAIHGHAEGFVLSKNKRCVLNVRVERGAVAVVVLHGAGVACSGARQCETHGLG